MSRAKRKQRHDEHEHKHPDSARPDVSWVARLGSFLKSLRLGLVACSMAVGIVLALAALFWVYRPLQGQDLEAKQPQPAEDLGPPRINKAAPPGPAPEGMVWIPGGVYWMGVGSDHFPPERPELKDARHLHLVYLDGFWMDRTEVTNRQFEEFVKATGYVTIAEQVPPEPLRSKQPEPFSFVFDASVKEAAPGNAPIPSWWQIVKGADWRHPEGPQSDLKGRENHPVVHIAFDDAVAYCKWAKKRLPTEAEWEFAARGGLDRLRYCWGNEPLLSGKPMANNWQGKFPDRNDCTDGFAGTAPVASFPANGFGLHDMAGNVWEWCSDWYHPKYYLFSPPRNPQGPLASVDPEELGIPKRVRRGGSFLCADNYCMRYLPGARYRGDPSSAANHSGFRCVRSAEGN